MNEPPGRPDSPNVAQARLRAELLADAFAEVFGQLRTRTAAQKRVFEHLETVAGDDQNSYRFHEAKDGIALIAAGIHRDGAKTVLRIINRQLQIAAKAKVAAPKARSAKTATR